MNCNESHKKYMIGGPSCDNVDIPFKNVALGHIKIDDKIYILNAGAYTHSIRIEF